VADVIVVYVDGEVLSDLAPVEDLFLTLLTLLTWLATVVGSPVFPANISIATGCRPWG
jgi:hypothetical protein